MQCSVHWMMSETNLKNHVLNCFLIVITGTLYIRRRSQLLRESAKSGVSLTVVDKCSTCIESGIRALTKMCSPSPSCAESVLKLQFLNSNNFYQGRKFFILQHFGVSLKLNMFKNNWMYCQGNIIVFKIKTYW